MSDNHMNDLILKISKLFSVHKQIIPGKQIIQQPVANRIDDSGANTEYQIQNNLFVRRKESGKFKDKIIHIILRYPIVSVFRL